VALTGGRRFAYVAGLILGVLGLLGARGGSLTEPPATSLLKIPVAGSRHKPLAQFIHRRHEARGVTCTQCHHDYQGKRNVWREGQPVPKCQGCHRPAERGESGRG
jgi:Class III cytochrome C family